MSNNEEITQKSTTFNITGEQLAQVIETAFRKGETWGVTYSTWFTPTKEDTDKEIKKACREIMFHVGQSYTVIGKDGKEITAMFTEFKQGDQYAKGVVGDYTFEVKFADANTKPSPISEEFGFEKLTLNSDKECLASFDGGMWNLNPSYIIKPKLDAVMMLIKNIEF